MCDLLRNMAGKVEMYIMTNLVKIYLFAGLKEKIGRDLLMLDLPDDVSVYEVRRKIGELYPKIREDIIHSLAAMNKEYVTDDDKIHDCAEVAFFPPVSGGCKHLEPPTICRIQIEEICINDIVISIITPTCGAVGMFTGVVRSLTKKEEFVKTDYLLYETYVPMAESKMYQIAREIRTQWPSVEGIAIVQRVGRLDSGILSVLIACAASHRDGCEPLLRQLIMALIA